MLPAISPAVISHLAMPNSGVRRDAAALQSLVSAGARDRLARAEEPVVRRLCAGGRWIRTPRSPRRGRHFTELGRSAKIRYQTGLEACSFFDGPICLRSKLVIVNSVIE